MSVRIINADVLAGLAQIEDESVNCCVTSPPYWGLRDYGVEGQIGLEATPDEFVAKMAAVFREVRRVLANDGVLFLNLGDSYNAYNGGAGPSSSLSRGVQTSERPALASGFGLRDKSLKPKDLVGIPWMTAFALRADGWYLRQEIIWAKPNPMPESVRDRCTKAHEHIFLLSKSERYFYDADAIREPSTWDANNTKMPDGWDTGPGGHGSFHRNGREKGEKRRGHVRPHDGFNGRWDAMPKAEQQSKGANKRTVWTIATQPYAEAHFATFPEELPETCIKAGCPAGGTVLDPFGGAGTTGLVADKLGRNAILIELNPEYAAMAERRIQNSAPLFAEVATATPTASAQISLLATLSEAGLKSASSRDEVDTTGQVVGLTQKIQGGAA
jgi:DNA modification methylase